MDNLRELVHPLPRIIRLSIDVLGAKVPPLETVHGAQVADFAVREADLVEELARAVAVPDLDTLFAQGGGCRAALDEPEELGDDGAEENALCCEEREDGGSVVVERELKGGGCEDRVRSGSGSGGVRVRMGIVSCVGATRLQDGRRQRLHAKPVTCGLRSELTCRGDARPSQGSLAQDPGTGTLRVAWPPRRCRWWPGPQQG